MGVVFGAKSWAAFQGPKTGLRDFPLKVRLLPGPNHFDFDSVEPAVRLSTERRQLRMFAVHGNSIRLLDPAAETAK